MWVPYAVVLTALGVARFWWAFWIFAVFSAGVFLGTLALVRHSRKRARANRPPMTGIEFADLVRRRWWVISLVVSAVFTLAFSPAHVESAWWTTVAFAGTIFVASGIGCRLGGSWAKRYEEEFDRLTHRAVWKTRGDRSNRAKKAG